MSRAWFPDYGTGKKRSSLAQLPSEGRHRDSCREKRPAHDSHMCVHIHTEVQAHVWALLSLPCLCTGGVGELVQHPLKGTSPWEIWYHIFTFNWLHATFLLKKYIICLLAWSVTKIIFTSVTLTVSGQEAERLCRARCLPAPRDACQEQSCCPRREGQIPC